MGKAKSTVESGEAKDPLLVRPLPISPLGGSPPRSIPVLDVRAQLVRYWFSFSVLSQWLPNYSLSLWAPLPTN
jgi:hypothetical protein